MLINHLCSFTNLKFQPSQNPFYWAVRISERRTDREERKGSTNESTREGFYFCIEGVYSYVWYSHRCYIYIYVYQYYKVGTPPPNINWMSMTRVGYAIDFLSLMCCRLFISCCLIRIIIMIQYVHSLKSLNKKTTYWTIFFI